MKRIDKEITETYAYDTYAEFEIHYQQMIQKGYVPTGDNSTPEYFKKHKNMDSYFAVYKKRITSEEL